MLLAACEQFLSKNEEQIQQVALETLEGHQRAIMGSMTVEVSHLKTKQKFDFTRSPMKGFVLPYIL